MIDVKAVNDLFDELKVLHDGLDEAFEEIYPNIDPQIADLFRLYEMYTSQLQMLSFELWKMVAELNK